MPTPNIRNRLGSTDPSLPTDPHEVLNRAGVPGMERMFIIGYGARQVTIHSQQVRALKLIWALDREKPLEGERIVVIGGGIAGITAASSALLLGANVTVLERNEEFLHLQRGCHTRYLHPAIYEWPRDSARRAGAALPVTDWAVGPASEVAVRILADYYRIVWRLKDRYRSDSRRQEFLVEETNARKVAINPAGNTVSWSSIGHSRQIVDPRAIVLAVGFGIERTVDTLPRNSYWRVDSLTQTGLESEDDPYRILVSGTGDGALLDLLRAKLKEFDHGGFLDECVLRLDDARLRGDIALIEQQAWDEFAHLIDQGSSKEHADNEVSKLLHERYSSIAGLGELDQLLEGVRPRTSITWVGTTSCPCSLSSQPLNRILAWRLLMQRPEGIEYRHARVTAVRQLEQEQEMGSRYVVQLAPLNDVQWEWIAVHQVVLRHGPKDEVQRSFPHIAERVQPSAPKGPVEPEKLPDDVRLVFANSYRDLAIRPPRTAWHGSVKLRACPEGDPVRRNVQNVLRNIYRIRVWLESQGELRHVNWVDYDLHPEYGGVQRRAMYISQALNGQHFRHWVNTWDDVWVRVRCSDGSELGEWLSAALQDTPSNDEGSVKRCAEDLIREAKTLRHNDEYRNRSWCDYVDLPWQSASRQ